MEEKQIIEEKALKVSMVGAFFLAVWGLVMAVFTGAGIVLLDGMFNLISAVMAFFSIEISRLISGRKTRDFPLGYFALESLFVFLKGASILVMVVMALYSNIKVLLAGGREPELGLMIIYVAVAVAGCFLIYGVTRRSFKKTGSEMLEAETQAWLINGVISSLIGVAFVIVLLVQGTDYGWISRYADQILVIFFAAFVIRDPLVLMKNGIKELLLVAPAEAFAAPFVDKLLPLREPLGIREMSVEVLKTGRRVWVTVYMDPEGEEIQVASFMEIKRKLRAAASEVYGNTDTEVILERG
jgi:predicted Co/Zn/Cd cation transporter (cation efflux family)